MGSRDVNESPEAFPATCARARFTGCTFMRHIILAINTAGAAGNLGDSRRKEIKVWQHFLYLRGESKPNQKIKKRNVVNVWDFFETAAKAVDPGNPFDM